jgi:sugar phosphate isomerase/epimerase
MSSQDPFYTVEELKRRQSMSTLVFWKYRPIDERAISELAARGIRRIELLESPEQFDMSDRRSMKYIGETFRSCGIQIAAYHAHTTSFSNLDTEAKRQARVDFCKKQIDTMVELGGRAWGSHAHETDDTLFRCYSELARYIEGSEIVILIENFRDSGLWIEDRIAFLDRMNHPQVGMILDIGHVRNANGENPMTVPGGPAKVIEMCRRHLRHVHLHGFKDGVDHFPPLCEGDTIQWLELFRMLYATGYPGDINFEAKGEPTHLGTIEATALAPERIVALEAMTRENTG